MRAVDRAPGNFLLDHPPADIDQVTVADTGRARRLAAPAGQAAIEMELRLVADLTAFEHLLDEVNTAPWPVELVAEQLVRGARRGAKAAVHTRAQNRIGFPAVGRVFDEVGKARFHVKARRTCGED